MDPRLIPSMSLEKLSRDSKLTDFSLVKALANAEETDFFDQANKEIGKRPLIDYDAARNNVAWVVLGTQTPGYETELERY